MKVKRINHSSQEDQPTSVVIVTNECQVTFEIRHATIPSKSIRLNLECDSDLTSIFHSSVKQLVIHTTRGISYYPPNLWLYYPRVHNFIGVNEWGLETEDGTLTYEVKDDKDNILNVTFEVVV